jgi:hypothetical protein
MLVRGMIDVYGRDKLVDLHSSVITCPDVFIANNNINGTIIAEISLFVHVNDTFKDLALKFNTTISASGDAHVQSQGQISAWIHNLQLANSTLIFSKVQDAEIFNIEYMFNIATKFVLPILNNKYLKQITIKLPSVEGITFNDSTVEIQNQYVELNVNPQFDQIFKTTMAYFKSSQKGQHTHLNTEKELTEIEELMFLSWAN